MFRNNVQDDVKLTATSDLWFAWQAGVPRRNIQLSMSLFQIHFSEKMVSLQERETHLWRNIPWYSSTLEHREAMVNWKKECNILLRPKAIENKKARITQWRAYSAFLMPYVDVLHFNPEAPLKILQFFQSKGKFNTYSMCVKFNTICSSFCLQGLEQ